MNESDGITQRVGPKRRRVARKDNHRDQDILAGPVHVLPERTRACRCDSFKTEPADETTSWPLRSADSTLYWLAAARARIAVAGDDDALLSRPLALRAVLCNRHLTHATQDEGPQDAGGLARPTI